MPEQPLEESIILDLEATTLGSVETPTTNFLAPFIIPIQFHKHQTVSHTAMETKQLENYMSNYNVCFLLVKIKHVQNALIDHVWSNVPISQYTLFILDTY